MSAGLSAVAEVSIPWRADDLRGARSDHGHTYDGGTWTGTTAPTEKWVGVRIYAPYGESATVELDMGDKTHGCTITLNPAVAREAAAALLEAADRADAEIQRWRDMLERQRQDLAAAFERETRMRAGVSADV